MKPPRLISLTRSFIPAGPDDGPMLEGEPLLVYLARVSNPSNQDNHDTGHKLLRKCLVEGHWSVFDMVDMTIEIHTSRAVMAQILRHWSFDFQEFSQRYAEVPPAENWDHVVARMKPAKGGNRQGSGLVNEKYSTWAQLVCKEAEQSYRELLDEGVAPECARMVLPLATTTRAYMKGSARSWITYFWKRATLHDGVHAQKEHRDIADPAFAIFKTVFPLLAEIVEAGCPRYITGEEWATVEAIRKGAGTYVPGAAQESNSKPA